MTLPPTFGSALREVVPDDVMLPRLFLAFRSPVFGTRRVLRGERVRRDPRARRRAAGCIDASCASGRSRPKRRRSRSISRRGATCSSSTSRRGRRSRRSSSSSEVAREIDRVARDGVTDGRSRARRRAHSRRSSSSSLQSAGDRADKLSMFATYFGDPSLVNEQAERYRAVTAEQVNAFARERLGRDNRASLLYVPRETAVGRRATRELARWPERPMTQPRRARTRRRHSPSPRRRASITSRVRATTLANGMRARRRAGARSCRSSRSSRVVDAGAASEPAGREGVAQLDGAAAARRGGRNATAPRSPIASSASAPRSRRTPTGTPRRSR